MLRNIKQYLKKERLSQPTHVSVGKYSLIAPPGHPIGYHLQEFKYYSRNVARIAKYIEQKYASYNIIDVGANIGDTIALLRTEGINQHIYSIEGEPTFYGILQKNLIQFDKVECFQRFLGEKTGIAEMAFKQEEGTAKLNYSDQTSINIQSLDDFIKENSISDVKLLKIDTDGFDFNILRGSVGLMKTNQPILFFEYDAFYLDQLGDDGISFFNEILRLGYNKMLYYDNYGKLLLTLSTSDKELISQLYSYMKNKTGAFPYYDVCVIHQCDSELAKLIIEKESQFFDNG
jgi:FkbM family methyltransferase